jgi:hypothetical protein
MLRSTQELKNLQTELKNVQEEKQLRQAQLEPVKEGIENMLIEMDATKG